MSRIKTPPSCGNTCAADCGSGNAMPHNFSAPPRRVVFNTTNACCGDKNCVIDHHCRRCSMPGGTRERNKATLWKKLIRERFAPELTGAGVPDASEASPGWRECPRTCAHDTLIHDAPHHNNCTKKLRVVHQKIILRRSYMENEWSFISQCAEQQRCQGSHPGPPFRNRSTGVF